MFCSVLFSFASVRLHSARAVYNARESVFAANHDNFIRLIFGAVFCRELTSCGIKIYKKKHSLLLVKKPCHKSQCSCQKKNTIVQKRSKNPPLFDMPRYVPGFDN